MGWEGGGGRGVVRRDGQGAKGVALAEVASATGRERRPQCPPPPPSPSSQAEQLQSEVDVAYGDAFEGLVVPVPADPGAEPDAPPTQSRTLGRLTEAEFGSLGRDDPPFMASLLAAKQATDAQGWQAFQAGVAALKLRRTRAERSAADVRRVLDTAAAERRAAARRAAEAAGTGGGSTSTPPRPTAARVVIVAGFESFNARLYEKAAADAARARPGLAVTVFCDADIAGPRRSELEAALASADAFFASLVFDYDQVQWLIQRTAHVPVRLAFECALELQATTRLGSFSLGGGGPKGPPPAVKKVEKPALNWVERHCGVGRSGLGAVPAGAPGAYRARPFPPSGPVPVWVRPGGGPPGGLPLLPQGRPLPAEIRAGPKGGWKGGAAGSHVQAREKGVARPPPLPPLPCPFRA